MVVELKVCLYNFYINIAINPIRWDTSIYDHNWVGTAPSTWQSSDSHLCHAIGLLQSWQKIKGMTMMSIVVLIITRIIVAI
jgi:hypothetical protein